MGFVQAGGINREPTNQWPTESFLASDVCPIKVEGNKPLPAVRRGHHSVAVTDGCDKTRTSRFQ
jgi:hypothetical protein